MFTDADLADTLEYVKARGRFGFTLAQQQLVVQFPTGGAHCCQDTLSIGKFQWKRSRFARTGSDSKPYKGA